MFLSKNKKDNLIKLTDLDALSCRYSSNKKDYFFPPDPFINILLSSYKTNLQYFYGQTKLSALRLIKSLVQKKKMPIINRGTYLRTKLIDLILENFINEFNDCQIISIGSGSDTRCFKLLESNKKVLYHEIDFPDSLKLKKLAILKNDRLRKIINTDENLNSINYKKNFDDLNSEIHTERYHSYGCDLRNLNEENFAYYKNFFSNINFNKKTLILNECVLCYMTLQENENIFNFWKKLFDSFICFLVYDPISLNDSFGNTMIKNLSDRGINLLTAKEYPTLDDKYVFFEKLNLSNIRITDINDIGNYNQKSNVDDKIWISDDEFNRINKLELIDEIEEMKMLFEHYCLCYAEFSNDPNISFKSIDKYRWKLIVKNQLSN